MDGLSHLKSLLKNLSNAMFLVALVATAELACAAPGTAWPQDSSDLKPDPTITFGALDNGMRYELLKNSYPAGRSSLRLRIAVGSKNENPANSGIAHFLEHMAFRGSTHFPDGEVIKRLSELGVRAGADANARTSEYDTVFQIDLPNNSANSLETALSIFRDIASNLFLEESKLESERKVVLSEERLTDNPNRRLMERRSNFVLQAIGEESRPPIGSPDVIKSATAAQLQMFYKSYYRPAAATLVMVGDLDLADAHTRIEKAFQDWRGVGEAPRQPTPEASTSTTTARVDVESGMMQNAIDIFWPKPRTDTANTESSERADLLLAVALAALGRRYDTAQQGAKPPFIEASVDFERWSRSADALSLFVLFKEGQWRKALDGAEAIRRGAMLGGLSQAEIDAVIDGVLSPYQQEVEYAATRATAPMAEVLVRDLIDNRVSEDATQRLQRVRNILIGLRATTVNAALQASFEGRRPLIWFTSNSPVPGGEGELRNAFHEAESTPPLFTRAPTITNWPYTSFGPPGKLVSTRQIADLDATSVTFANGVHLNVKPASFAKGQVTMIVSIGGGNEDLPRDRPPIVWAIMNAFLRGGLQKIDYQTMQALLADKKYDGWFTAKESAFSFDSVIRPDYLETQLQVVGAYFVAPAFRPAAFEQARNAQLGLHPRWETEPYTLLRVEMGELLDPGDKSMAQPTNDEVRSASLGEFRSFMTGELAHAPIEVTLVGDIKVPAAINSVAVTLGALKRTSTVRARNYSAAKFPSASAEPLIRYHKGRADQGAAAIVWPTVDWLSDSRRFYALQLLASIVNTSLSERLRSALGTSYTVGVLSLQSQQGPKSRSIFQVQTDVSPDKAPLFFDEVGKIVSELRSNLVPDEEFDRAKKPRIAQMERNQSTNYYWATWLDGSSRDPRRLDFAKNAMDYLKSVTPESIQKVVQQYLRDDTAFKVIYEKDPAATTD